MGSSLLLLNIPRYVGNARIVMALRCERKQTSSLTFTVAFLVFSLALALWLLITGRGNQDVCIKSVALIAFMRTMVCLPAAGKLSKAYFALQ
jgi:hypothetical protein